MLVKYVRDGSQLVGCVVAVAADKVGFSICNPLDRFKKEQARSMAAGRALAGTVPNIPNRQVMDGPLMMDNQGYFSIPDTLPLSVVIEREVEIMKARASRYFKPQMENV